MRPAQSPQGFSGRESLERRGYTTMGGSGTDQSRASTRASRARRQRFRKGSIRALVVAITAVLLVGAPATVAFSDPTDSSATPPATTTPSTTPDTTTPDTTAPDDHRADVDGSAHHDDGSSHHHGPAHDHHHARRSHHDPARPPRGGPFRVRRPRRDHEPRWYRDELDPRAASPRRRGARLRRGRRPERVPR